MSKARYIFGILFGVSGIIAGIAVSVYLDNDWSYFIIAYAIGSFIANLIWFDGPVITVATFGIHICTSVFAFFFGTGLGCLLILCAPIAITICAAVLTLTLIAIVVVSFVMFPINAFRFAGNLD